MHTCCFVRISMLFLTFQLCDATVKVEAEAVSKDMGKETSVGEKIELGEGREDSGEGEELVNLEKL